MVFTSLDYSQSVMFGIILLIGLLATNSITCYYVCKRYK